MGMDRRWLGADLDKPFMRLGLFAQAQTSLRFDSFHLLSQHVAYAIALNAQTAPCLLITI